MLFLKRLLSDEPSGCECISLEGVDLRFSFTPDSVIEKKTGSVCGNSWYITFLSCVLFWMVEKIWI